MSKFESLKNKFSVNWTTILVGWEGLGTISPWPNDWEKYPTLINLNEVYEHCYNAFNKKLNNDESNLIFNLLAFENKPAERALIRSLLQPLAELHSNETSFELRKWRVIMLGEVLEQLSNDPLYDWLSISEFWMYFGHPKDSPIEYQNFGKNIKPKITYTKNNMGQLVEAHKAWIQDEISNIKHFEFVLSKENLK